ncbi:hypothetical protein P4O66_012012 [Electrophorus voltai]|uniref:Reverse transcriptase domain-containing protein n=1 Tax=Electrophorus voltai TaxID=2609070 RepID=A0AAD9DUH4_9TELE|nr:hypothetical protein P4O66_012012 [Electrophorus voltai]
MMCILYSRDALISLNLHGTHLKPSLTPDPRWPMEILRENKGRDARKRPRGKRAGIRNKLRARAHRAPLLSILLANVQSLANKLDDLQARIMFQLDIRDCNLCFTESWLNPVVPSHAIEPAEFFLVHYMDRTADSGKSRGGGVCMMVNNSWCNNANVANMDTALCELHEALTQFQAQHGDAALIVVGDFNSANLKHAVPNLYQHVTFPTRGNRTLDHCYTPYKDSHKALAHPPFGKSDHASIFLIPKYKQSLKREASVQKEVTRWTDQLVAALQDALDDADWDMFRRSTDDVSEFTEAVVGFIGKLVDDTIPRATIKKFPNQKPWVDRTIREALNSCTAAYNAEIISGNMDEYKSVAYGVRRAVREAKRHYGRKLETQFQQSGSRSLWQGLQTIKVYRSPPSELMSADESLANELNTFFARFEATSSSANANSANSNNANGAIGTVNSACTEPTIEQRPLIITESDMRRVFKRVNTRKAAGPDGICGRVLKACADQLAPVFTDIFNLSLTLGIVPSSFKRSTIVPVPKKPRPSSDLNDYRPVALTSVVMKCFEKLVRDFITSSLPASMDPLHFAYRHNRSTDDAIAHLLHTTLTHLDEGRGNYVKMLFVDYSSAFNTIIPSLLTTKLGDLGLHTSLCDWISNFLTDRPQSVRVGNCASSTLTLSTGAPQGCVLSPLLYSLYTYDCTATSSSNIIVKFADDTVVVGLISDNDERAYLEEIKHLENWCQENNLLLNDLSWSRHTSSLAKKARQRLYHLRRLRDFRLPSKVLRNFYTCTIESILTGNITVWFGNSTRQDRQALQRVVRSAERITHSELPDLQTTYYKRCQTKARKIVKDPTHPNNRLFSLLSKIEERHYQPVRINRTTVETVDSFRYRGVHISQDLSWSRHTSSLAKKARQHLYHLRHLRDFRGPSTKQDRQGLQRVVRSAEHITYTELPDLQTIYYKWCQTKARRIVKDPTHPNNRLFSLLSSRTTPTALKMMPSLPHFICHSHIWKKKGTYVRMLFIDFSSAFNTIVPQHLIGKLSLLGFNTSLCNWILDFLTGRPQFVWIGSSTSNTTTLSTGAPQGSVLSPLLFTLLTHDCAAMHSSNHIIKFADDITVVGLINKDNESAYREEVRELVSWCKVINLYLNVDKTKEMVVDFRRARRDHSPLVINGSSVEIVKNIKFLGVHIAENLTWTLNTSSITKRAQQRLCFLRKPREAHLPSPIFTTFNRGTVESILSSCIITWFGNCTSFDRKTLQRIVRTAEKIIGVSLPSITNIYVTRCIRKATNIVKDPTHPSHELFTLLPSGRRYRSIQSRTSSCATASSQKPLDS